MYEHLVKNVRVRDRGNWTVGIEAITLEYEPAETGVKRVESVAATLIGAIETWLAQPQPPTPEERAKQIVETWALSIFTVSKEERQRDIALAIESAIKADRAERGET